MPDTQQHINALLRFLGWHKAVKAMCERPVSRDELSVLLGGINYRSVGRILPKLRDVYIVERQRLPCAYHANSAYGYRIIGVK